MEKDNDEMPKKEKEKIANLLEQVAESKKKPVAKDLVKLTHVEVKKQKVSQETKELMNALKKKGIEKDQSEELSNDEITILETFTGKRLFLNRIAIIANQSRIPLGIEPFKKAELEEVLNSLIEKNLITSELVGENTVYFLTEKGSEFVQ